MERNISEILKSWGQDPSRGLPEEIFLLVSSLTPLVNVDLLIQDESGRTLLTWRNDGYYPPGWHIPGGIIRYKEKIENRLKAVARQELEAEIDFDPTPLAIHEIIDDRRKVRGHFISLLYRCRLLSRLSESRRFQPANPRADDWMWHASFPPNMISVHAIYRSFFQSP